MATDDRTDCLRGNNGFFGILFLVNTMNRFKDYSSVLHVDNLEDLLNNYWDNPVKRLYRTPTVCIEDMLGNAEEYPRHSTNTHKKTDR